MRKSRAIGAPVLLAGGLAVLAAWQAVEAVAIPAKAFAAQLLLARAWNASAAGGVQARPWPGADTWPVARIEVPRLSVDQIVLAGANGRTLAFGPARLNGTAATGGGGSVVLFGHRDTHFRFLQHLRAGDRLTWSEPGRMGSTFTVAETAVLHKDALSLPALDARTMLLVTCYPFDAVAADTPLRYVALLTEADGATVAR